MGSDNWLEVEPPKDANGEAIPLDTEILYPTSGRVFHVEQFRYSVREKRWVAYGHYAHMSKLWADNTSCFLLTKTDSWEKLEEDESKGPCTYFGMREEGSVFCDRCPYGIRMTGRKCGENMVIDLVKRAKRLAGVEEREGE